MRFACASAVGIVLVSVIALPATTSTTPSSGSTEPLRVLAFADSLRSGHCRPFDETVTFHSHVEGGTEPYVYLWDFGDGSTGGGADPSHTYYAMGMALAIDLTVWDARDSTGVAALSHWVGPPRCPIRIGVDWT